MPSLPPGRSKGNSRFLIKIDLRSKVDLVVVHAIQSFLLLGLDSEWRCDSKCITSFGKIVDSFFLSSLRAWAAILGRYHPVFLTCHFPCNWRSPTAKVFVSAVESLSVLGKQTKQTWYTTSRNLFFGVFFHFRFPFEIQSLIVDNI